MNQSSTKKSESSFSKRRLGIASIAAFIGCAACCAIPLLAAAGIGSGVIASLSSVLRPGSEFLIGTVTFVVVLGFMVVRNRLRKSDASGCGPTCKVNGACCDRGTSMRNA